MQEATQEFWRDRIVGSILDQRTARDACAGHDAIVCFHKGDAELSSVGTAILLGAAQSAGISQIVYTSSAGMTYPIPALSGDGLLEGIERTEGHWRRWLPVTESHGLYPGSEAVGYFMNKWMGEQIGAMFVDRGVCMTAIRPGNLMHEDMGCRDFEAPRVIDHVHLLMCGHVTVRDAALVYRAALECPAGGFRVVNLSNDTAYAQVSTDAARRLLGFACTDPQPYLDFYARQDWERVYGELERRGLAAAVLDEVRAARPSS